MNDLRHYAFAPVDLDRRTPENGVDLKPSGLWVSVGSAWLDWCRDEDFRTDQPWFEHTVGVSADASILHLATEVDLDDLTHEYGEKVSLNWESRYINWGRVAEKYDGIVISPYQWSRRSAPHTFWYYGWDVASGCIWNPDVVSLTAGVEVSVS